MNEGRKYPIAVGAKEAIECNSDYCALFGAAGYELVIKSDSNVNTDSWTLANGNSYNLPAALGEGCEKESSSINGGKESFQSKEFEVYAVFVSIIPLNYFDT